MFGNSSGLAGDRSPSTEARPLAAFTTSRGVPHPKWAARHSAPLCAASGRIKGDGGLFLEPGRRDPVQQRTAVQCNRATASRRTGCIAASGCSPRDGLRTMCTARPRTACRTGCSSDHAPHQRACRLKSGQRFLYGRVETLSSLVRTRAQIRTEQNVLRINKDETQRRDESQATVMMPGSRGTSP